MILSAYPLPFIRAIASFIQEPSTPPEEESDVELNNEGSQEDERKPPLAVIPYVSGVSKRIRKACEKFDLRAVFISGLTLRSLLTKVKDPLPMEKLAGVVYKIPCQCGKVDTWKSAIAKHQWDQQHQGSLAHQEDLGENNKLD